MTHCELLQTEETQVVVGDQSRDGAGGAQYCGLWFLTSKHRPFSAFKNSAAGLIPDELRRKTGVWMKCVDDRTCVLRRKSDQEWPVDVLATYKVAEPYYVDHSLTFCDRKDVRIHGADFRESNWCSYMNGPPDNRLHFLSGGTWQRYMSSRHGAACSIAPSYVAAEKLEAFPPVEGKRPFNWDRAPMRFDQPFYYGRIEDMVLISIFDCPRWLRFFCSPTGGGPSLIPGRPCPAWDFNWVIPCSAYEINKEYTFRMRLVYKQFVSDDDVLQEFHKSQKELGFQTVTDIAEG